MTITVENDFYGFPKVKWLHLPGGGQICKIFYFKFSGLNTPKIIKIGYFLTELLKNENADVFWDTINVFALFSKCRPYKVRKIYLFNIAYG